METRLLRDGQETSEEASSKNCQVALRNTALGIIISFKDRRLLILKNKESFQCSFLVRVGGPNTIPEGFGIVTWFLNGPNK